MRGRRYRLELDRSAGSARGAFLRAAEAVAAGTGVPFGDIVRRTGPGTLRRGPVRAARMAAIYLAVTALDKRMGAVARALGRPRKAVLAACRAAELARDDAAVDALFTRLEAML